MVDVGYSIASIQHPAFSIGKKTRHDRWRSHRVRANFTTTEKYRPPKQAAPADDAINQIRDSLRGLRFGSVNIIVQDGVIIQIDRTEKRRLRVLETISLTMVGDAHPTFPTRCRLE